MEKSTLKDRVEECFEALKKLENIPATPANVSILCGVYDQLKIIYKGLEEQENAGRESGPAVDSDGRNDD